MNWLNHFKAFATQHQFMMAIIFTVFIAIIMTGVSLSLYVSSGTLQLDLSRPGYETARKELIKPQSTNEFATNGPINKQALEEYQKLFDEQRKELNSIGKFKDKGLDDDSLTIAQGTAQN